MTRAGNHVTFVYDNIVSQQMVFAIFFDLSFKILLIYIDHVPGSSGIKLSNIALVLFYSCLHKLVTHIFYQKIPH